MNEDPNLEELVFFSHLFFLFDYCSWALALFQDVEFYSIKLGSANHSFLNLLLLFPLSLHFFLVRVISTKLILSFLNDMLPSILWYTKVKIRKVFSYFRMSMFRNTGKQGLTYMFSFFRYFLVFSVTFSPIFFTYFSSFLLVKIYSRCLV